VMDICAPLRKLAEQLAGGAAGSSGERMQELLNQVGTPILFTLRAQVQVCIVPDNHGEDVQYSSEKPPSQNDEKLSVTGDAYIGCRPRRWSCS
jgi:hypothetical protein